VSAQDDSLPQPPIEAAAEQQVETIYALYHPLLLKIVQRKLVRSDSVIGRGRAASSSMPVNNRVLMCCPA
jgi:hypothetical protein